MEDTQYVVRHDPHAPDNDRTVFEGLPRQCRICLSAMMSVAYRVEHEGDGFWCDSVDGFRIKFEIRDSKPGSILSKQGRRYI